MFPHMTGMAKLDQAGRLYWGPRISGAGIQNILWADPRTVEDVEECVNAMRYEGPESKYPGLHGVGMRRDVGFVLEGASLAALEGGDDGVCAIMIEKKEAVEDLQSLLSVPGVDMVQFGPSDYAMSMGVTGQGPNHPKVKEGELKTVRISNMHPPFTQAAAVLRSPSALMLTARSLLLVRAIAAHPPALRSPADQDRSAHGHPAAVRKRHFLRHLYIKINILPRQARDKHRENSKKVPFSRSVEMSFADEKTIIEYQDLGEDI
eukprot:COSAG06_NODE_4316_length_4368_cov_30.639026_4_plen_263_part_00